MERKLYRAGFLVYALLFVLSLAYYKERIINLDASLYLFEVIRSGDFVIFHYRFIAAVTEAFPLLAIKMSLPLNVVMMAYSGGFIVYYLLCYLFCGAMFKNYKLGLALLLYHILFTSYTFYWSLSEFIQGVSLMFPFLAFVLHRHRLRLTIFHYILVALFTIFLAFAHPLMLFPLSYSFLYFILREKDLRLFRISVVTGGIFFITLVVKTFALKEAYDSSSMHGLGNFVRLFPDYFNTHSNRTFLANCLTIYQWIPITFIAVFLHYVIKRQPPKLLLFCGYIAGYLLLINISYPTDKTGNFYIENMYLPLGVFLALPLVFDVLPGFKQQWHAAAFFSIIAISSLIRIYHFSGVYEKRLDWYRDFLAKNGDEKLLISAGTIDTSPMFMSWASPYEFWLLSTLEQGKTASITILDDVDQYMGAREEKDLFIPTWGFFRYHKLPKPYFKFTDTSTAYQLVK